MNEYKQLPKHVQAAIISIKSLIDDHPLKNKKLNDLASVAGIDRSLLQAGFKQLFGMRLREYQTKKRLEWSIRLLDEGTMSIKEISYRCGYSSQNSYTKAFKKQHGITPKVWKTRQE